MSRADPQEGEWRPATLRTLGIVVAFGWVAFGTFNAATGGRWRTVALDVVLVATTLLLVAAVRRWPARARLWTHAFATTSSIGLVGAALLSGGARGDSWVYLALVPLFVGQMLSIREALGWACASMVLVVLSLVLPTPVVEFVPTTLERGFGGVVLVWMAALFAVGARREASRHLAAVELRGRTIAEQARELAKTRDELAGARDRASALANARGDFVATLSHELRTPLNGILGLGVLLLDSKLEGEQREMLQALVRSAENQRRLLDEVLDLARIESGRLELVQEPFDLRECLEDVADLFSARAAERGLELAVVASADLPERISGDRMRVEQIVANLVSNAVKLTTRGRVVVGARCTEAPRGGVASIAISVEDTGPGIAKDRMEVLFRAFEQADPALARIHGGTGLGLAVSRRIARAMGGELDVESELDRGSTFRFTWQAPIVEVPRVERRDDLVVVIDARDASRRAAVEVMQSLGSTAVGFASVEDARSTPLDRTPRLVLVGATRDAATSPAPDGGKDESGESRASARFLSAALRSWIGTRDTSLVLVVTSGDSDRARAEVAAGRFDAWTIEPLRRSRARLLRSPTDPPPPIDEAPLPREAPSGAARTPRALVVDDDPTNRRVAVTMLRRRGWDVVEAASGEGALESLSADAIDVAFVDLHMPGIDGFDVARRTIARSRFVERPLLVAFSASVLRDDRDRAVAAGFHDFLEKPIHRAALERIASRTESMVSASARSVPSEGDAKAATSEEPETSADAFAGLRAIFDDDELRQMIDEYLLATRTATDDIGRALAAGDLDSLGRTAHRIVGASATLGAVRLGTLARTIEQHAVERDLAALRGEVLELRASLDRAETWLRANASASGATRDA